MTEKAKFRYVYVENCSHIPSHKPLLTGTFSTLDEIKERISAILPVHSSITIEYYNKKSGIVNRHQLEKLPHDLEDIYMYLRSKKPMVCSICEQRNHNH
jgi:hypothetical protein